jgi:hypothetical protein
MSYQYAGTASNLSNQSFYRARYPSYKSNGQELRRRDNWTRGGEELGLAILLAALK